MVEAMKKGTKKSPARLVAALLLFVLFVLGNIWTLDRSLSSAHFDWRCRDCGVVLYENTLKNLRYMEVPASYLAHDHNWLIVHKPLSISPLKPWHWLACALTRKWLRSPSDPRLLFEGTHPSEKYSHPRGLAVLANDTNYPLRDALFWATTSESPEPAQALHHP